MIALIALPTLAIYVVIIGITWLYLTRESHQQIESELKYMAGIYADKFDKILQQATDVADMTSNTAGIIDDLTEEKIFLLLQSNVHQLPFIYGSCMAFEPGTMVKDDSLYAPYVYRTDGGTEQMHITREVYDWYNDPQWEWFRKPKQLDGRYWSAPYFDEGAGNVRMVTYSAPFYRSGKFSGVVTVDLHLPRLKELVGDEELALLKFDVYTKEGEYVYSDRAERIMHKTVFELAEEHERPDWARLGENITEGQSGMVKISGFIDSQLYWTFYTPISSTGWSFVCRIPEDQALADLRKRKAITLLGTGLTLSLIVACIFYMSGLIAGPIAVLNRKVLEVAGGNLQVQIEDIQTQDEIGTLSRSFNKMTVDLRAHVDQVAALTKLKRDLQVAKEIQQNTLPKELPSLAGFDVEAWNEPAEETGGDIYDIIGYQLAAESQAVPVSVEHADRAILLLADATGHGIAPALSVTQLRAMLRIAVHISQDLSVIAEHLNEQLCADLPPGRFITAWLATINTEEQTIEYFSAGQGPLLRYNALNEKIEFFDTQACPFGVMEEIDTNVSDPIVMHTGDIFAVISDGIFESMDADDEQFGTDRVIEVITSHKTLSAKEILNALREAVGQFTHNRPADDDRTIIIIKRV
jgi:sigma-B regulation protein RsbU (phosphoserine phosphatase)